MSDNKQVIDHLLDGLKTAKSIEFFELNKELLKENDIPFPDNLEELKKACLKRSKADLEQQISLEKNEGVKNMLEIKLLKVNKLLEGGKV